MTRRTILFENGKSFSLLGLLTEPDSAVLCTVDPTDEDRPLSLRRFLEFEEAELELRTAIARRVYSGWTAIYDGPPLRG